MDRLGEVVDLAFNLSKAALKLVDIAAGGCYLGGHTFKQGGVNGVFVDVFLTS